MGCWTRLAAPIGRLERQIAALAKPDPRVQALMVLPGVGRLTAMTLVAEIGDIARFPTARKLCAWAGLTPTVRNLRPHGPPRPHHQAGLGVGALASCRRPPNRPSAAPCSPTPTASSPTAAAGGRRQIATVAIARRLLARAFHILTHLEVAPTGEGQTGRARMSA